MNKRNMRKNERFANYIRRTLKNKLVALAIITVGVVSIPILEGDGTIFVMFGLIGLQLFFAKDNWLE